jgi:hypothetical protein
MRLRNAFILAVSLICAPVLAASEARSDSYRPDIVSDRPSARWASAATSASGSTISLAFA